MRYDLRKPCGLPTPCPFRTDVPPYLRAARASEIATALLSGSTFPCHKTVSYEDSEDGDTEAVRTPKTQMCAGAMATMLRSAPEDAQLLRLARHMGKLTQATWDALAAPTQPVYGSLTAWVDAYTAADESAAPVKVADPITGEVLDMEHCGVVGSWCEDPAGYAVGGGAVGNTDPPTCNPLTDECPDCNRLMCSGCRGEDGRCRECEDGADGWDDYDEDDD